MGDISNKIKKNIKEGTLLKNGSIALKNRIVKSIKQSNLIYWLDPERVKTKNYLKDIPPINHNHYQVGNYYLDKRLTINEKSIAYSLGILTDIDFDLALANQSQCQIFMYDPTPLSIKFMEDKKKNPCFNFFPYGVWIEDTELKFYTPKLGGSSTVFQNSTINDNDYFIAECYTMNTLMKKNNHSEIDIFKADIEGAALPILEKMIKDKIFPKQIIVEFERPKKDQEEINSFFSKIDIIRSQLKEKGFEEYLIPRSNSKYFSMELLFVKLN